MRGVFIADVALGLVLTGSSTAPGNKLDADLMTKAAGPRDYASWLLAGIDRFFE
ncbi:MAG: hypothetical protein O2943_09850 [Actinomycetota bacterium]|nr:hypothetical protein [Actinomycetota bacterium]